MHQSLFVLFLRPDSRFYLTVGVGIFCLALLPLIFYAFGKLIRPFRQLSKSARQALPVLSSDSGKISRANEIEFVSQTFTAVVAQLQQQQRELGELHSKLGARAASAEAFNRHIVSSLPSGLIAFDLTGRAQVINEPAREIFGFPAEMPIISVSFEQLFEFDPRLTAIIADSLTKNKFVSRLEIGYQTQNSRTLNLSRRLGLTISPLIVSDKIAGVLCLVADITEINLLREQLAVQRNLESLGLMSAGLAHEFKNALAALHGYAQFINRLELADKGHQAAAALTDEVRKLSAMVTSFLNFAKPQPLILQTISLQALVDDCVSEISDLLNENKIELHVEGEFPVCRIDPTLIRQVILNLLRNALEAVRLNPESTRFLFVKGLIETGENREKWVSMTIEDTGDGIKAEDLAFVFVPFFTTKPHGHGLGLALSHRIVTQHGGSLSVENSLSGGAVFNLRLKVLSEQE